MDIVSEEYAVDQAATSSAQSEPVVSVRGLGAGQPEPRQTLVGEAGDGADVVSGEGEHAQTCHFTQTRRASTQPSRSAQQPWTVYSRWPAQSRRWPRHDRLRAANRENRRPGQPLWPRRAG
jgi:hypothetical protein